MDNYSIAAALSGTSRPNFLVLTPLCVFLGAAIAIDSPAAAADLGLLSLVIGGAILAHVSVNMLNEYEDFRNGLDLRTERTPFSGGSGTLPQWPQAAAATRRVGWAALLGTLAIGAILLYQRGAGLLPIGALGLLLVGGYSTHIVRWPLASLVAPGLGFGPLMVMGTAFVVLGEYTTAGFVASLVPFFLVSNLLLLNQFPDVEADRDVGRRNLPILLGRRRSSLVYAAFLVGAYGSIGAGVALGHLPPTALIAALPALPAIPLARGVHRHADDVARLEPLLGWNVALTLGTIALLALGIVLG